MDKILKEKSNRVFFLKAILLGIQYSESGKADELKIIINQELNKLNSPQSDNHNHKNEDLIKNNLVQNGKLTLQKYEQILHDLNEQRLNINNKISNIQSQSYTRTLSLQQSQLIQKELFSLKKMILVINKEIEKYSLLHQSVFKMTQQPKISSQENIMKKNNVTNYLNPSLNNIEKNDYSSENLYDTSNQPFFYKESNQNQHQITNSKINKSVSFFPPDNYNDESDSPTSDVSLNNFSNNNHKNENISKKNDEDDDNIDSNDLLKELQRTFGNLSSLLNSS